MGQKYLVCSEKKKKKKRTNNFLKQLFPLVFFFSKLKQEDMEYLLQSTFPSKNP